MGGFRSWVISDSFEVCLLVNHYALAYLDWSIVEDVHVNDPTFGVLVGD